jgi:hypothetical protein
MSRLKWKVALKVVVTLAILVWASGGGRAPDAVAQSTSVQYPEPRFPSAMLTSPDWRVLLYDLNRQYQSKLAFAGYTPAIQGATDCPCSDAIVYTAGDSPTFVQALIRKLVESHGGIGPMLADYELVGVSKSDAEALYKFNHFYTAEKGYMEVAQWIDTWPNPTVPQNWLKTTYPALYAQLYPPRHILPANLQAAKEKLTTANVGKALQAYVEKNPEAIVSGVSWGSGDWIDARRALGPLAMLWIGPAPSPDGHVISLPPETVRPFGPGAYLAADVAGVYPDAVWMLSEQKTVQAIADVDRIEVTDPEGTDLTVEIPEEMAQRWAEGVYERGSIELFPHAATGRFARTMANYPAATLGGEWVPRAPLALANGVLAGTVGDSGFYPRIQIYFKDGYVSKVDGGGTFGDLLRAFLKYPNINTAQYPDENRPGWFYLYEIALGTHPKRVRDPSLMMVGDMGPEYKRSGVLHFGLGLGLEDDNPSAAGSATWQAFTAQNNLPGDPGFFVNNYFATYRVHLRSSNNWVVLVDKGRMTSLDDPEVRRLASQYGDAAKILAEDWIPAIPGINASGKYEDYAADAWKYATAVIDNMKAETSKH